MRHRKIGEQSGVLVPTSGEPYCDSSRENGYQAAPWYTGLQLSISTNTFISNYGAVTVTHTKDNGFMFARASCLGMCELWSKCRLGANPALHGRSFLDFGVRGVCLSWMNTKQTFCQFLWANLEQCPNMFGASRMQVGELSWISLRISFPIFGKCLTGMRFWSECNFWGGVLWDNLHL